MFAIKLKPSSNEGRGEMKSEVGREKQGKEKHEYSIVVLHKRVNKATSEVWKRPGLYSVRFCNNKQQMNTAITACLNLWVSTIACFYGGFGFILNVKSALRLLL